MKTVLRLRLSFGLCVALALSPSAHGDDLDMDGDNILDAGGVLFGGEGEVLDDQIRFQNDPSSIDFDETGLITAGDELDILVNSATLIITGGTYTSSGEGEGEGEGENVTEVIIMGNEDQIACASNETYVVGQQTVLSGDEISGYADTAFTLIAGPDSLGEGEGEGELVSLGALSINLGATYGAGLARVMLFGSMEDVGMVSGKAWTTDDELTAFETGARLMALESGDASMSSNTGASVTCQSDGDVVIRIGAPSTPESEGEGGGEGEGEGGGAKALFSRSSIEAGPAKPPQATGLFRSKLQLRRLLELVYGP